MAPQALKAWKTRLLLTAGALFLLSATSAHAGFGQNGEDNSQLVSRINQLENQVQTLSRSVYRGEAKPLPMGAQPVYSNDDMTGGGSAAGYDDRMSQIEAKQREMTGQIEQLGYELKQIKTRLDRMANDSAVPQSGGASYTAPDTGRATPYSPSGDGGGSESPRGKVLGTMPVNGGAGDSGASGLANDPGALYDNAFNDIRDAKYESAASKFALFLKNHKNHPLAANAQYWLAETYYVRQDYKNGAKLFAQNYQDYPQGPKASASLLKLGLSLAKLGKKDDACLSFAQLKKQFPGDTTPEVRRAQTEMKTLACPGG
ncbi:MAG TPA: tol-pal system protein YbgF [Patescibacteria group bacterium]|nr:tol-pal system protein YbgF [Patescibacteria group bacterium]